MRMHSVLNKMLGVMVDEWGCVPQSMTLPGEVFDQLAFECGNSAAPLPGEVEFYYHGYQMKLLRGLYRNRTEELVWHAPGSVPPASGRYLVRGQLNSPSGGGIAFADYDPQCPDALWCVKPTDSYTYTTSEKLAWAKIPLGYERPVAGGDK